MDCKICTEAYDQNEHTPYTINPCGHCFCLKCLNSLTSQLCPMDRTRIVSKTINRGILDILTDESLSELDSLKNTLLRKLDAFESTLDVKVKNKLEENSDIFLVLRSNIDSETQRQISKIFNDSEMLGIQLNNAEISNMELVTTLSNNVKESLKDMRQMLKQPDLDLATLRVESRSILDKLNRDEQPLDEISFQVDFVPTNTDCQNQIGFLKMPMPYQQVAFNSGNASRDEVALPVDDTPSTEATNRLSESNGDEEMCPTSDKKEIKSPPNEVKADSSNEIGVEKTESIVVAPNAPPID